MRGRIAVYVMALLLVIYLVATVQFAFALISAPPVVAKIMGAALLVLPLIGAWLLVAELQFATRAEKLARRLGEQGLLPVDDLPRLPSGRIDPKAADERFPGFREAVEAAPGDWAAWFRLGLAYDASGDRRMARWATRRAIRLERGLPTP